MLTGPVRNCLPSGIVTVAGGTVTGPGSTTWSRYWNATLDSWIRSRRPLMICMYCRLLSDDPASWARTEDGNATLGRPTGRSPRTITW